MRKKCIMEGKILEKAYDPEVRGNFERTDQAPGWNDSGEQEDGSGTGRKRIWEHRSKHSVGGGQCVKSQKGAEVKNTVKLER